MPVKITPSLQKALYACCDTPKGLRDFLKGVYYHDGEAVASDAHTLVQILGAQYDPAFEGKIVDRVGKFIEEPYADYHAVIPDMRELQPTPNGLVGDLRRVLKVIDKKQLWVRVAGDLYLSTVSLGKILCAFDTLKQMPVMYINRDTYRAMVLLSENCVALSMPCEPYRPALTYAENSCYDYDLLGI